MVNGGTRDQLDQSAREDEKNRLLKSTNTGRFKSQKSMLSSASDFAAINGIMENAGAVDVP